MSVPSPRKTPAPLATLASEINLEHRLAFGKAREALEHARRAGELLLKAKAEQGYSAFLPWLKANVECCARTAQRYMALAKNWQALTAKYDTVSHLSVSSALKLLKRPETELERARAFEERCREVRGEILILKRAAEAVLADPHADLTEIEAIDRRASALSSDAASLHLRAQSEAGRLITDLKRATGLGSGRLLAALNDGSLLRACDERIADLRRGAR